MILNRRRVQNNWGRYCVFRCVLHRLLKKISLYVVVFNLLNYFLSLFPHLCLTGNITLEPLTASKYCTILWIRNGINCFLQLLSIYTWFFLVFLKCLYCSCNFRSSVCSIVFLNFVLFPSARALRNFTTACRISLLGLCMHCFQFWAWIFMLCLSKIRLMINFTYTWSMCLVDPYINFYKSMDSLVNQQYAATLIRYFQA
jgi:hypothetical protein